MPSDLGPNRRAARRQAEALPREVARATIVCPLCGAGVPARGLRPRGPGPRHGQAQRGEPQRSDAAGGGPAGGGPAGGGPPRGEPPAERWELVFSCPACGLVSAFASQGLSAASLRHARGSPWAASLRRLSPSVVPALRYTRAAGSSAFTGTFIVSFVAWLLLTGSLAPLDLLWGLVTALAVTALTYRFAAIQLPARLLAPRRWLALGGLLVTFARQLVVQNVTLAVRVLRPDLPIRPGIVAVPTRLRDDAALTLLGSLMTLTPDTVTLDLDRSQGLFYVHWIDVRSTDPDEAHRLIAADLEEKIDRWLG
jgi:multicomponent Na+:H+ antiporter subunit E